MTTLSALSPTIRDYLDGFVVRARRAALVRAAGAALAACGGWVLLWCVSDRFLQLPQGFRLAGLIGAAVLTLAIIVRPLWSMRRPVDWVRAAWEVERHNPEFGQRLVTVTSRLLGAADYRGSDEILLRLAREVDAKLAGDRHTRRPPLRSLLAAWAVVALELLLVIGLLRVPELGLRHLARRFAFPFSNLPPVTTTQLVVEPGDADVIQSRPLTIQVQARDLEESPVTLFLGDGSRLTMTPTGAGNFSFTIASVDRDIRYHITGGDARSPEYVIRVLRKPTVSQFRVRYEYPPYTHLAPLTATTGDGRIEAPAGTRALLTVVATEPLQSALLTIGRDKILMDRTGDEHSRQTELVVRGDSHYELDLISTREVAGSGPSGTMYVHAVPDLPPQVRLAREGESLRLNPRDVLPLGYEALDDYGIASIALKTQVNSRPSTQVTLPVWGDARRQQDVFNLDLAALPLAIGDLVTLTLSVTDTAGHVVVSEPLHVLVCPQSVDLDTYERVSELRNAAQRAQTLVGQLDDAAKAQDDAEAQKDHQSPAYQSASSRGDRALTLAAQTAALLRQSLLRAITHSDSDRLSLALAGWVDLAERQGAAADEAFRQSGAPTGMGNPAREKLREFLEQSRRLESQLQAVQQGQQAAALLADRANLRISESTPAASDPAARNRLNQTLQHVREEMAREAREIGLDLGAADLDAQLHGKVDAADAVLKEVRPVDFVSAVRQWSVEIQRDPQQRLGLESRLWAAAQAEAIRPDADLARARDLELESRATAAIAVSGRGGGRLMKRETLDAFTSDIEALARVGEMGRTPATQETADLKAARLSAAKARQDLARWAGDLPEAIGTALATRTAATAAFPDRQREAEDLAMQASAAAAAHDYRAAGALDQSMVRKLESRPRRELAESSRPAESGDETEPIIASDRVEHHRQVVRREMARAQRIDDLGQAQSQLAGQTRDDQKDGAMAGQQQSVAEQIARAAQETSREYNGGGMPNARDLAAAQVLGAQEQLAGMPQAMAEGQAAAAARRDAAARASAARQQAQAAAPEQRDAANRAADQAAQDVKDATARFDRAVAPLMPGAAGALADRLEPFAPESAAARAALAEELVPALATLQQALSSDDPAATDRAASEARRAIESAQRQLAAVQDTLVKRDPLLAAKWFARAAAESLALRPPDVGRARARQADASAALSRAWDQSIHRAASARLSALPSLAAIVGPPAPVVKLPGQPVPSAANFPAAREWGRLRAAEGPELHSPLHDTDPPGFEEALRLYFEALGKAQESK